MKNEEAFSYVTLTTNRDVKGVVALHNSLASNGSPYPVVCLFSELSDSNKARRRPPWGHKFLWELWNNYYES